MLLQNSPTVPDDIKNAAKTYAACELTNNCRAGATEEQSRSFVEDLLVDAKSPMASQDQWPERFSTMWSSVYGEKTAAPNETIAETEIPDETVAGTEDGMLGPRFVADKRIHVRARKGRQRL